MRSKQTPAAKKIESGVRAFSTRGESLGESWGQGRKALGCIDGVRLPGYETNVLHLFPPTIVHLGLFPHLWPQMTRW